MNPRSPGGQWLIARSPRTADPTQQSWSIGPPSAAAPFDPAAGFPWAREGGEVTFVATLDPSEQAWAVGPPQNVVLETAWSGDPEVVTLATNDDPTVPAWAVGPPQNAVVAQSFNVPDETQYQSGVDDSAQAWAVAPPQAAGAFDPSTGFPWARQGDEPQAAPSPDDTQQAWSVGTPLNTALATVFNTPDDATFIATLDDTLPALTIQPPVFVPVFALTAWAIETGDERQAIPVEDPSVQAWAIGQPQNAVAATTFNVPQDQTDAFVVDDTTPALTLQPQAAAAFDPASGFPWPRPDDVAQPTWWTPDETTQPWTIAPIPFIFRAPDDLPFAWWARVEEDVAWSAWASVAGAVVTVTGGYPPTGAASAQTPPGSAAHLTPGSSGSAQTPIGDASHPTPKR